MDSDTMEKGNEFTYVNNVKEEEDDMNDSSLSTDEGPDDEPELTSDEKPAASSKAKAKAKPKPKTTKVNGGTALKKNGKKGAAAVTSEESPEKKARSGQIDKLGLAIEVARAEGKPDWDALAQGLGCPRGDSLHHLWNVLRRTYKATDKEGNPAVFPDSMKKTVEKKKGGKGAKDSNVNGTPDVLKAKASKVTKPRGGNKKGAKAAEVKDDE